MSTSLTVHLRLVCINPPPTQCNGQDVMFGLQDKDGILQPGRLAHEGALVFECDMQALPGADGAVNFRGKFAHGPAVGRFLYLSLKYAADEGEGWIKRLKIPLSGIRWHQIETADHNHQALEATVDGSGAATVPLMGGAWTTH